jgi:hypothetical protein
MGPHGVVAVRHQSSSSSSALFQTAPQRKNERRSSSWSIDVLYGLGIAVILFATGTIVWSTRHLNKLFSNATIASISNSKAQFLGENHYFANDNKKTTEGQKEAVLLLEDIPMPDSGQGAIIPFGLSVNFLQRIVLAPGAPPEPRLVAHASKARVEEDFLPVVAPSSVNFRWRHQARVGSSYEDASKIQAYRIIVRRYQHVLVESNANNPTLWDSGRGNVAAGEELPDSVAWGSNNPPTVGHILEWMVQVWDNSGKDSSSSWTKFAVGPEKEDDWKGEWIVHPHDMDTFDATNKLHTKIKRFGDLQSECKNWKKRRPLPLFRMKLSLQELNVKGEQISSALLVISGLGSFRASFDGVPLSTSGPIDPAFTDYSKRVMYRGFDVTPFLLGTSNHHVIGVTMGSGWWDHRPVTGMAKPHFLPRGPVTVIAQIMVTYTSGETRIVGQSSQHGMANWQVTRGHIRESDLFTGEMVDLNVFGAMEGWDTTNGWQGEAIGVADGKDPYQTINAWVKPVSYRTEVTHEERKQQMAVLSSALPKDKAKYYPKRKQVASPIGRLVPSEIPPVMAMERIAPDEIHDLGSGRWLLDFGRAFSGMLHFDEGLPQPIIPHNNTYPRAHGFRKEFENDSFITVVYGESLELTTGDINRVLVAGMGLHDGGPRHKSKPEGFTDTKPCFPEDHDKILTQKDVYVVPKNSDEAAKLYSKARQSHFTTHAFRFAEICCTSEPPRNVHALLYRTAMQEWGTFDSSSVLLNGGYELVKNSMRSNLLSVQSDCPHREKLPYGGDLIANSPSAMHMFDMSAFYKKTIRDWMDAQWGNGAYTETSVWQKLNDYAGIGKGAGETVWATAPPVLTVRHMQHYGDLDLLVSSLVKHLKWLQFLDANFEQGMLEKGYDKELNDYLGQKSGLGDWLGMRPRDTFITHAGFYMAAARSLAYISHKVGIEAKGPEQKGMATAKVMQDRIAYLYMKNGKDNFDFPRGQARHSPGPEMGLFARIVPGEKRCVVLENWFRREGSIWPGNEEKMFLDELSDEGTQFLLARGDLTRAKRLGNRFMMTWSMWQGFHEGIFSMRYSLRTLSEMGYHHIALRKATGTGMATFEYLLGHNATTMWESWWRSEDLYSRNHPMLGASAEWMSSSVAGVSVHPTTVGGRRVLFWPQFPKSAKTLTYASAIQGTPRGDFAIAWRFENLPQDRNDYDSALVTVRIRLLVPPGGSGVLRPPPFHSEEKFTIKYALSMPDLFGAKSAANDECINRREARLGFPYSWGYDRNNSRWFRLQSSKSIGTPCPSFLFHKTLNNISWSNSRDITQTFTQGNDEHVAPGFYELIISNWQLEKEVEGTGGRTGNLFEYVKKNASPYCNDESSFEWDINDAHHLI